MTLGNEQHVANAPIVVTPISKWGVKLHEYKIEYYADPTNGDNRMTSWAKCAGNDVAHCTSKTQFVQVMRTLYAKLATEAHKRAAESAE